MATITTRTRADGTVGYTVQIRIARDEFKHTEAQTFGRKPTAEMWSTKREAEPAKP